MNRILHNKPLIGLVLLSILSILVGSMISPIEFRYLNEIIQNKTVSSFAFTVGTIASILGIIAISHIANHFGRNRTLVGVLFFSIFIPLLYANISTTLNAFGVKFAWAFSLAGAGVLSAAFIQNEIAKYEDLQGKFFGVLYSAQSGMGFIGAAIGGYISDKVGMTSVFYTIMMISILELFIILFFCNSTFGEKDNNDSLEKRANILDGIKYIWSNRELRARFIMVSAFGASWSTKVILYPLVIFAICNSNTITGTIIGTQGLTAMIVLPIIGVMVDRWGYSRLLWIGYIILGTAILLFSLTDMLWLIWIAVGLVALGEAISGTSMSILEVRNIPDDHRNSVVAVHNAYATIVETLATLFVGILLGVTSPRVILGIISIMIFITLGIGYRTARG